MSHDEKKPKDPDEKLDFAFDWATEFLAAGETISSYTVDVEAGITLDSDSELDGVVTVWLTGGTVDTTYAITCTITTSAGRIKQGVRYVRVRNED